MKRKPKTMLAGLLSVACAGSMAVADDQAKDRNLDRKQDRQAQQQTTDRQASEEKDYTYVTTDNLIGLEILASDGESIATISDIVLDSNGQANYFWANVGGVAGLGGDDVAIPVSAVQSKIVMEDGERKLQMMVEKTQDELENAPKIESEEYAEFSNQQWVERNNEFFGVDRQFRARIDTDDAEVDVDLPEEGPDAGKMTLFSEIDDHAVMGSGDEEIAQVDALVFDTNHRAEFAILGIGGVLGVDKEYRAVPFQALQISEDAEGEHIVRLNATEETLEAAPKVSAENQYRELLNEETRQKIQQAFPKAKS